MDALVAKHPNGLNGTLGRQVTCLMPTSWDSAGVIELAGPDMETFSKSCTLSFNVVDQTDGKASDVAGSAVTELCPVCSYEKVVAVSMM